LFDVADRIALASVLAGVDHVVYALGTPFASAADRDPVLNVAQTLPPLIGVLEELRNLPGVGLSFLSSGGTVYGNPPRNPVPEEAPCDPITGYGIMKLAAEKYVAMYAALYGIRARSLRISNVYGSTQTTGRGQGIVAELFRAAQQEDSITVFGDGDTVRDYVLLDDVAKAVVELASLQGGPTVVNVGSGQGHSVNEVASLVERITGSHIQRDWRQRRPFDIAEIVLDVSRLTNSIAWQPVPLDEGLKSTWDALIAASDTGQNE
jgi:UDP-glucose 4-epimerase